MQTTAFSLASEAPPPGSRARVVDTSKRTMLWHLHGAITDLVCAAVVTSFGYALYLELGGEPILFELQRTLEKLIEKADRLERWLLSQGWELLTTD